MRDIKFRLWDISKCEMTLNNSFFEMQKFNRSEDELSVIVPMQFTGINDKNGNEIYEGDILELPIGEINNKYRYTVVFEDGAFVAYHTKLKDGFGKLQKWGAISQFKIKDLGVVVIGNIFENPELFGGKNYEH